MGILRTSLVGLSVVMLTTIHVFAGLGDKQYVSSRQANLFSEPSEDSEVVLILAVGRQLLEFERKNGFLNVGVISSGGIDGWIKESDIAETDPDGL